MKYVDDETKEIKWYNANICYSGTLIIVLINVLAFLWGGNDWVPHYVKSSWADVLDFNNIVVCFLSSFEHSNWQHCLLNCLCFLIAGSYVERKIGTVNLLLLTLVLAFYCECVVDANDRDGDGSHGFSGVNYGIYAYIIIDYIFTFIRKKQTKINIIYGAIVLGLIYLACCFCGGTSSFEFALYPYDLMTNMGHYSSFLAGLVLTLIIEIVKIQTLEQTKQKNG